MLKQNPIEENKPKKLDFAKFINDKLKNQNNENKPKKLEPKIMSSFGGARKEFLDMLNKKKEPEKTKVQYLKPKNKDSNTIQERINQMQGNKDKKNNIENTIKIESKTNNIQERIKKMKENQNTEKKKENKIEIDLKSNTIQERIKQFGQNKNIEKNVENSIKIESKQNSIQERIKQMKNQQQNNNTNKDSNNYNFGIFDRVKDFNKEPKELKKIKEEPKNKILENSEILSEEECNMIIYKYPNIPFSKNENNNSKIILFLGNAQECFINTFINIYRNISFKDKFRYKFDSKDLLSNKTMIYDIKSYDLKKIII